MKYKRAPKKPDRRPTIGYLAPIIHSVHLIRSGLDQWAGVVDAAQKHDVNLICFPGWSLHDPRGFLAQANVLYDLASAENVDGVVSWASSIGNYVDADEIKVFHERYRPLPVVSIGRALAGHPSLLMDSYEGMREAIMHLIEVHGYRRLAFIRGPENHFYAQKRYRAYTDVLQAYDLPLNPDLVTPPSDWSRSTGMEMMRLLLDERKLRPQIDFEVIVSANDGLLLGAMEVLRAREIRVPGNVAAAGFDDTVQGRMSMPPLTSVTAPFYEMGYRAVETLLALLEGKQVPEEESLPSKLVVRQSCGCEPSAVMQAAAKLPPTAGLPPAVGPARVNRKEFKAIATAQREEILAGMARVMKEHGRVSNPTWAGQLLDAFATGLAGESADTFLAVLSEILRQAVVAAGDMDDNSVAAAQNGVSALRRSTLPYLDEKARSRAEDLWQQARVAIAVAAERAQAYQMLQAEQQAEVLSEVGQVLLTTFDVEELLDVLVKELPRLDIPAAYLSLYEDPEKPTEWSRLMMAYGEEGRVDLSADGVRFPSRQLVPEGMWPQKRQYSFVVNPLYFQDSQIGFILCEVGPREGPVYETLSMHISNALQGALLVQRVEERSAELTRQQYILDTFMENIPDFIYFKDLESRITRANKAHAARMGLDDPSEEIGKSDFDFFPEERARAKYELEQEIIRTGQPALSLEETDGAEYWVLTTKMPLRDEHGEIIGTFGISHDITEMKQAQAELVRRERLSALGQLTATVAHEIRNPLGTVRTSVFAIGDAIEQGELERVERALQLAERNIVRCDTIISELLDYTRDWVLQCSPTDIDEWLNGLLDEVLNQGNIPESIVCIRELNANVEVSVDTEHLRRAIINVVNNAVDAMQEKGHSKDENRLTISTRTIGKRLEIRVSDTGDGIPDEMRGKLFEPLFSTKSFGVGLGLPIVKGIMEQHGGGIEISSHANEGTTVVLWLPI